jgi:hypothetical protein
MHHPLRDLSVRLGRTIRSRAPKGYHLELDAPILIRQSGPADKAALERLATLDGRRLPEGSFLLGEVDGELVAAAPLDVDAELLKDPFRPTGNVRELLRLQAGHVRRHRPARERHGGAPSERLEPASAPARE